MASPRARKITPNVEKEIIARAADGESARAIAEWLAAERGIKVSRQAVNNVLQHTRRERAEVAKAVVREHLTKTVVSDLERLAKEQARVERISRRLYSRAIRALDSLDGDADTLAPIDKIEAARTAASLAEVALKASDRAAKLAQVRLHFSGADSDDEGASELAEAEQRVRSRIAGLSAALREGEAAEGDRADP